MVDKCIIDVKEFPLRAQTAQRVVQHLAANNTEGIKYSAHARQRMYERRVTTRQVLHVLQSKHSTLTELPCQTPKGSWKFNLTGFAAGERLDVVIDLRKIETAPEAYIVTVFFP